MDFLWLYFGNFILENTTNNTPYEMHSLFWHRQGSNLFGGVGDDSTLETSPAEDDDRVLLCVHLPLQLKNHAGKWNPTCKRQEKYHSWIVKVHEEHSTLRKIIYTKQQFSSSICRSSSWISQVNKTLRIKDSSKLHIGRI